MGNFTLQDHIESIELNGLKGRMICAPARRRRASGVNILFVHGHHNSLERMAGVAELMVDYGNFCLPDLPGFGGMGSFFTIGLKPTIENYADYLAAFIKLQYGQRKKFVIVGYSMGFLVVTRMLQKYPDLARQTIDVISFAGFVHHGDFSFSRRRVMLYKLGAMFGTTRLVSWIIREVFLRKWFLFSIYRHTNNAKHKLAGHDAAELRRMVEFEYTLWRCNDIRTWCYTTLEMFKADCTRYGQVPEKLIAVTLKGDQYFDATVTEQHLRIVYKDVKLVPAQVPKHSMSVISSAEEAALFFPPAVRTHITSLRS